MTIYKVVIASNGNSIEPCEHTQAHIGVVERILDAYVVYVVANSSHHAKVIGNGLIDRYTRLLTPRRATWKDKPIKR